MIHRAELAVLEMRTGPPEHLDGLPSTMQYNALLTPSDHSVEVAVAQSVLPGRADRFQIALALGQELRMDGPWGEFVIKRVGESLIAHAKMRLRLVYNEEQKVDSDAFGVTVRTPAMGFKARKIAGVTLEEKMNLLSDPDINVVESTVRLLGSIGGPEVSTALMTLQKKDLTYLRDYYAHSIYSATRDPHYYRLPAPNERLEVFKDVLAGTIRNLHK